MLRPNCPALGAKIAAMSRYTAKTHSVLLLLSSCARSVLQYTENTLKKVMTPSHGATPSTLEIVHDGRE